MRSLGPRSAEQLPDGQRPDRGERPAPAGERDRGRVLAQRVRLSVGGQDGRGVRVPGPDIAEGHRQAGEAANAVVVDVGAARRLMELLRHQDRGRGTITEMDRPAGLTEARIDFFRAIRSGDLEHHVHLGQRPRGRGGNRWTSFRRVAGIIPPPPGGSGGCQVVVVVGRGGGREEREQPDQERDGQMQRRLRHRRLRPGPRPGPGRQSSAEWGVQQAPRSAGPGHGTGHCAFSRLPVDCRGGLGALQRSSSCDVSSTRSR